MTGISSYFKLDRLVCELSQILFVPGLAPITYLDKNTISLEAISWTLCDTN